MKSSKKQIGTCRICGQEKELSFEHVPPRIALNKTTRHVSVPHEEWTKIDNFSFSIYKDNNGDLWLGTHENGAYKFNGTAFEKFTQGGTTSKFY